MEFQGKYTKCILFLNTTVDFHAGPFLGRKAILINALLFYNFEIWSLSNHGGASTHQVCENSLSLQALLY